MEQQKVGNTTNSLHSCQKLPCARLYGKTIGPRENLCHPLPNLSFFMKFSSTASSSSAYFLSLLRIVAGLVLLEHGTVKVLNYPPGAQGGHVGLDFSSLVGASGAIELAGGSLLVIGLFSRFVAFILSGEMAVAYFMVHFKSSFFPILNKGELAVILCFVFLYLAVAGPGPWSVDGVRRRL
jgi:putative oxidoreductase